MLKHIRNICSSIVAAQHKHAARKASEAASSSGRSTQQSHNRSVSRPVAKLNPNTPPITTATNAQSSSWPELMSPAVEQKDKLDEFLRSHTSGAAGGSGEKDNADGSHNAAQREVTATGVSYAVAIYLYMAEQDDEFDVVVYVCRQNIFCCVFSIYSLAVGLRQGGARPCRGKRVCWHWDCVE